MSAREGKQAAGDAAAPQPKGKQAGDAATPQPKLPLWPAHLPEGCPGETAAGVNGDVYRIIFKASGSVPKDWKSHAERCTKGCDVCKDVHPCERAALSIRITLEDAQRVLSEMNKYNRRFEAIARATLTVEHGKIAQTGNDKSHYSLWLRAAALEQAGALFVVVHKEDAK